jgi:hypothetical protein
VVALQITDGPRVGAQSPHLLFQFGCWHLRRRRKIASDRMVQSKSAPSVWKSTKWASPWCASSAYASSTKGVSWSGLSERKSALCTRPLRTPIGALDFPSAFVFRPYPRTAHPKHYFPPRLLAIWSIYMIPPLRSSRRLFLTASDPP